MEKVILNAELRKAGRHSNRELRDGARVPAVVYGQGAEPHPVSLEGRALGRALHKSSGGVIEMEVPGLPQLHVLVREIQRHPTRHFIQHVDFLAVSMTQKVRVHVPVVHEGVAPVLGQQDMVLVRGLDSVEIECLPGDIPVHLVADLTKLLTLDDEVLVKDIVAPAGVKVLTDGSHVAFAVSASRAAEVEEAAAEAATTSEPEVIKRKKEEEEVA